MSFKYTAFNVLFCVKRFASESKHFSVSGFLLRSSTNSDLDYVISSNSARAPESFISQLLSFISYRPSQKVTAAATHFAPLLPIGESDISISFSLFSMTPFKYSSISLIICSSICSTSSSSAGFGLCILYFGKPPSSATLVGCFL